MAAIAAPKEPLVVGPYHNPTGSIAGLLGRVERGLGPVWSMLCHPASVTAEFAARMLAVFTLQGRHPLLHPISIPTRPAPPMGIFYVNGSWSDLRRITVPPEVAAEVDRLATLIASNEKEYVAQLVEALRGVRPDGWEPLQRRFGLADPNDECSIAPPPPPVDYDASALGTWGTPELFSHLICEDYRRNRYLRDVTDAELEERALDAVLNMYEYESPRILAILMNEQAHLRAFARFGEVITELEMRHGNFPQELLSRLAGRWALQPNKESTSRALDWFRRLKIREVDALAKFGKQVHLREMMKYGRIRLSAASGYKNDPTLNRAQSAEELQFSHEVDCQKTEFQILSKAGDDVVASLHPTRARVTRKAATDAYVFCTSRRISARLFDGFNADACLVIRDRKEFMRRVSVASAKALSGWRLAALEVRYLDSFEPAARHARPLYDKPVKYEYQQEHRVLWLPRRPRFDLDCVWLELGSLADTADLYVP